MPALLFLSILGRMTPTSLTCRMACASACAYGINPATGVYCPPKFFNSGAGFTTPPQAFTASNINAGLVGLTADGIVVAFRGTIPPDPLTAICFRDWMDDFFAAPKATPAGTLHVPGQAHSGFYDSTVEIIGPIAAQVRALDPTIATPIYVTGHSKGGAMASVGAYIL